MATRERQFPNPRTVVPARACGQCGHDLTASKLKNPCPRCGWRPSVRCVTCGYDLDGLHEAGPCPECATPIAESIRGDGLAFAKQEYLRTLVRGLGLVRWGIVLLVLVWVAATIVLGIFFSALPGWAISLITRSVFVVPAVVYAAGWWLATTPDPRLTPDVLPRSAAYARWLAIILATALLLRIGVGSLQPGMATPLVLIAYGILVTQVVSGAHWLRFLSGRAPNARASRHAMLAIKAVVTLAVGLVALRSLQSMGILPTHGSSGSTGGTMVLVIRLITFAAAIVTMARVTSSAGLIRDDLRRFLSTPGPRPGGSVTI